ncbi:uncharacterized protein [Amphiura filiformis]|uniref:uncharacterized protein n=1 Tax=Amphiura filiformis TaxID=82378 RepID=UPI003B224A13
MDIFLQEDVSKLLWNKFLVVIGDSNQRSVYKDLVNLVQNNSYTKASDLKCKGEHSFMDDQLLHGGRKGKMMNGVNYREVRQYKTDYHLIRFYFVTRVHNKYVESIWEDLSGEPRPDVIIMNSCLWDVSRYGPTSMNKYKSNLEKTFRAATDAMPPECLFIWNTALPVANKIRGGFLLPELDFLCSTLRLDVLEGNFYAKELARVYGLDVLDLHFFFRFQLHRRAPDGVHWNHQAHRRITNLILTHITNAWGLVPPRHVDALSRALPPPVEPQPAKPPSPVPDCLNFIDFDKPLPGSSNSRPTIKSCPAALGKMPTDEGRRESSSSSNKDLGGKTDAPDDKIQSKVNVEEPSRPKSVDAISSESLPRLDENRPKSVENRPSSTGSQSSSSDNRPSSAGSIPKSTGSRPITPPSNQPGILGPSPRKQPMPITRVITKPRKYTRFAPYQNNHAQHRQAPPTECNNGPTFNSVVHHQVNQYSFNVPAHFNNYQYPPAAPPPQAGYYQGQYQADMEWRHQQRMNRVMHDRHMEFNWFGGFNWG